jgi:hypothetical protein
LSFFLLRIDFLYQNLTAFTNFINNNKNIEKEKDTSEIDLIPPTTGDLK